MKIENVLISGAGIGGPALAWWLLRAGVRVTVVERAASLRSGGQLVDFRGPAHMDVLRRMGLLDDLRACQSQMGAVSILDRTGKSVTALPSSFMSGEIEVSRGDLSRLLYASTRNGAEYVFGDAISRMTEQEGSVEVHFERSAPRSFDLVVGADGLHSIVRALTFGEDSRFLKFHDHYVAGFALPNVLGLEREGVIYSAPGLGVSFASLGKGELARAAFVFRSPLLAIDRRDAAAQKALVAAKFAGLGWEVPKLLDALSAADDVYFDAISSVVMPSYASGRIVLLGDAGYGGTLGGQGTGLAMVGAYVLAGELAAADDHRTAFLRYEERLRPYAEKCQSGLHHVGPFYAPETEARRWLRDRMYGLLASRPLQPLLVALTTRAARGIALEAYPI